MVFCKSDTTVSQLLVELELKDLKQVSIVLLDILFLDIDVSIGLNTAMETAVKRVNSRSDWLDANQ